MEAEDRCGSGKTLSSRLMRWLFGIQRELRLGIGHALASQIDAHEPSQCGAVEQRVLAGGVGQVETVLFHAVFNAREDCPVDRT